MSDAVVDESQKSAPPPSRRRSVHKILVRALIMAVGIGIAGVLLAGAFDDLDLDDILDAIKSLDDAERLSLIFGTTIIVWSEGLLMASFVLLVLGGERPQLHGGIKYVTLNLVSSAVFLAAVGILYGLTGTLNLADLARKLDGMTQTTTVTAVVMRALADVPTMEPLTTIIPDTRMSP